MQLPWTTGLFRGHVWFLRQRPGIVPLFLVALCNLTTTDNWYIEKLMEQGFGSPAPPSSPSSSPSGMVLVRDQVRVLLFLIRPLHRGPRRAASGSGPRRADTSTSPILGQSCVGWAVGFLPSDPISQLHGRRCPSEVRLPPLYHPLQLLQVPCQLQSPEMSPGHRR